MMKVSHTTLNRFRSWVLILGALCTLATLPIVEALALGIATGSLMSWMSSLLNETSLAPIRSDGGSGGAIAALLTLLKLPLIVVTLFLLGRFGGAEAVVGCAMGFCLVVPASFCASWFDHSGG